MIKLPEPVGQFQAVGEFFDVDAPTEYEKSLGWEAIYTEAQLKQAVRDALNEALSVVVCRSGIKPDPMWVCEGIRALIKEIE